MSNQNVILDSFIKSYADKTYQYPTLVRHQGVVIAFAMDQERKIYYSVLNLNAQNDNSLDVNFWSANPKQLNFPNEIAEVGFGITDQTVLPIVKKGSRTPVSPGTVVKPEDIDEFLSSTARLTADAPFQVISDGRLVYVFRQAIAAQHPDIVTVSGPRGVATPIVNSTLLCDRFVLSGVAPASAQAGQAAPEPELQRKMEVRFRRSRSKTRPQSNKDSLGARDMQDQPFFEPTQELSFVRHLEGGRFSIVMLPTSIPEIMRWQIFAYNSETQRIDSYNVERSLDGLFNTRGTQGATEKDAAETALEFLDDSDRIDLGVAGVQLGDRFSQEAWIFPYVTPQTPGVELQQMLIGSTAEPAQRPPSVWIVNNRQVRVGFGDGQQFHSFITGNVLISNAWNHVAVVYGEERGEIGYQIYLNGNLVDLREEGTPGAARGKQPLDQPIRLIGGETASFHGKIDEVRLWNRQRGDREIRGDKNLRLTGAELGLQAYWRLDEGSGEKVFDSTGNHLPGGIAPASFAQKGWVPSDAPIGENAGVNRDSFGIDERAIATGMSAMLYFQQENARSGYDQREKPIKQSARVMVALGTQLPGNQTVNAGENRREIATIDFGVSSGGKLAKLPDNVALKLLDVQQEDGTSLDVSAQLQNIQALQAQVNDKTQRVVNLTTDIDFSNQIVQIIDDALANRPARALPATEPQGFDVLGRLAGMLTTLQQRRTLHSQLRDLTGTISNQLRSARVTVYEHQQFGGRSLTLSQAGSFPGLGFFGYTFLNANNFNDIITSISIPAAFFPLDGAVVEILEITAFSDANRGGRSRVFGHTANVGRDFNDVISSIDVREKPEFQRRRLNAQRDADAALEQLNQAQRDLQQLRNSINTIRQSKESDRNRLTTELTALRLQLQSQESQLNNGLALSVPLVHTDTAGLSISGGILKFAWTEDTPLLFDSATGNLSLYFRGVDDQFFVAYYRTLTQRAQYPFTDNEAQQTVIAFAKSAESELDRLIATVTDGESSEFCTVTIAFQAGEQEITETWNRVVRSPQTFAKILNGLAGDRTFVGRATLNVVAGRVESLSFDASGLKRSLVAGATLIVGDVKVLLSEAAQQSNEIITVAVQSDVVNPSTELLPVFYLEYDYRVHASSTQGEIDLSNGSRLMAFLAQENTGEVKNQEVKSGTTLSNQWVAAAPGRTLAFDGKTSVAVLQASDHKTLPQALQSLAPRSDVTMEMWLRPNQVERQARVLHYQPQDADDTRYFVGLKQRSLLAALEMDGTDQVLIADSPHLNFAGLITLEAWVKPAVNEQLANLIVHGNQPARGGAAERQVFLRINQGNYEVGCHDGTTERKAAAAIARTGLDWTHLAGVYDGTHWRLYINGEQQAAVESPVGAIPIAAQWGIGAAPLFERNPSLTLAGAIADVRIWRRARNQAAIQTNMNRELTGIETDLMGYWRFDTLDGGQVPDRSRHNTPGSVRGNPQQVESPLPAYSVFAGVGEQMIEAPEIISGGNWNHFAAVFNQSYGLRFDGENGSFLDAGRDLTLDISRDLTIEAYIQMEDLSVPRAILSRGRIDSTEDPDQKTPYAFYMDVLGRLVLVFEDVDGNNHVFVSNPIANPTGFHKVAVTRKRESISTPITNDQGQQTGVNTESFDNIHFFVDDQVQPISIFPYRDLSDGVSSSALGSNKQPADVGSSNESLVIGAGFSYSGNIRSGSVNGVAISDRALAIDSNGFVLNDQQFEAVATLAGVSGSARNIADDSTLLNRVRQVKDNGLAIAPCKGIITEIRIWNTALDGNNILKDLKGGEKGLVSWWRMEENEGNLTLDAKSTNHAKLKGTIQWTKDPSPNGSSLVLYRNGVLTSAVSVPVGDRAAFQSSQPQLTLGALQHSNSRVEFFQGEVEEIRVWNVARSQEQIQDNLFRRLMGEQEQFLDNREALLAYYPFDVTSADKLADYSLQGNALTITNAPFVLSTAPIGDDTPQIRSALAGLRTPFNDLIKSTPAVQEYGDLQAGVDGNLFGVFKRCYGFIQDGQWKLITGFKVGDLITEWIGQVQFDPQIIGYIEGAPPVPGENLTVTGVVNGEFTDYNSASSVALNQANKTRFTFSANRDTGFDASFNITAGILFTTKISAGVALITEAVNADNSFGLKAQFETSLGFLDDASTATEVSMNQFSSLELRGFVENRDRIAFQEIGRRFVPQNVGFALVQSQTADVFALRLKHNNALVSMQIRPNPDIPPDRNIISFPINPQYTKQGTLDGKIGFNPDPDYPNALTFSSDSSFYKPIEAFALKQRIQRQEEEIRAYYEQYDAGSVGRRQNATHFQAGDLGDAENRLLTSLPRLEKRNLVNTYVWTADGGLFAETQESLDVLQESTGGSYSFKGLAGLFLDARFTLGSIGAKLGLEALFGGHINLQVTKSQESENSFGLDVNVDRVERDVFHYDPEGNLVMDLSDPRQPKPLRLPGKVDAYRFMSFYLEPQSDHFDLFFDRVVDPIWLEQSTDAGAIALRSLRDQQKANDKKPPCWRIMHRVTFVSRVLPRFQTNVPLPPLEEKMRELNIDSNFELIKRLEPFVIDKVDDFGAFSQAVDEAIATFLPELQPHAAAIKQFLLLFYGLTAETGLSDSDAVAGLLGTGDRAPNQAPTVRAGRDQTLQLVDETAQLLLQGAVADDRLEPEAVFVTWTVKQAPREAVVTFSDVHALTTTATLNRIGRYVLELTADDGLLTAKDTIIVLVNQSPLVDAGEDQTVDFRETVKLKGALLRDGRGDRSNQPLRIQWERIAGPGTSLINFTNPNSLDATASFERSGVYLLRLTASFDTPSGPLSHSDDLQITVGGRATRQLQALYTFADASSTVRDVAGVGSPLDLSISDPSRVQRSAHALTVQRPASLSASNLNRVIESMRSSNELTLEAWITPADLPSTGLARILTISSGPAARNLILGQLGNQIHVGIRTSTSNANASNQAFSAGTLTAALTHVVCTREASGMVRVYLDGREVGNRNTSGTLSTWDPGFGLALGNELGEAQSDRAWSGSYHLVALYSRALTPKEIQTHFEFGADTNLAPVISAGADQIVNLPGSAELLGLVTDDRFLSDQVLVSWSQPAGPAPVTFSTPNQLRTTASFPSSGLYTLRLTVDDGEQAVSDDLTVTVHQAPVISLPAELEVNLPQELRLSPTVQSGLGTDASGQAIATSTWSLVSGPGSASFSNANSLSPTVRFSDSGTYALRLTVSNGLLSSSAEVVVRSHQVPQLRASAEALVTLPAAANLVGEILNAGLGNPSATSTVQWSLVRGPGSVTFANASALVTSASFSSSGVYVLRLTVNNGRLSASRDLSITANRAPVVDAGTDQTITLPAAVQLDGTVSDDGFPSNPGSVALLWSQVSGPGPVTFANPNSDFTTATFSVGGVYELRLTADDGAIASHDEVTITVNQPPTVNAGVDQSILLPVTTVDGTLQTSPAVTTLNGTVQDDSLPAPATLTTRWQQISGPATVTFTDASAGNTQASFSAVGTYVLEFSASDGLSSASARMNVTVSTRVTQNLRALYTFQEGQGNTVRDVSGVGQPLDLNLVRGAMTRVDGGRGIAIAQLSLIASAGPATKITNAVKRSNALTVEAWVRPADNRVIQGAPNRIVTLSGDTGTRNFTLGLSENQQYVFRLRTTTMGINGANKVLEAGASTVNQLTHLVYTRDAEGNATLYVNGVAVRSDRIDGNLSNWDDNFRFALANELTGDRPWLGEYYLVAVYSRALSASEVTQHFNVRF